MFRDLNVNFNPQLMTFQVASCVRNFPRFYNLENMSMNIFYIIPYIDICFFAFLQMYIHKFNSS
jgi:hypothetical protein